MTDDEIEQNGAHAADQPSGECLSVSIRHRHDHAAGRHRGEAGRA
jgi:hypothetical protein